MAYYMRGLPTGDQFRRDIRKDATRKWGQLGSTIEEIATILDAYITRRRPDYQDDVEGSLAYELRKACEKYIRDKKDRILSHVPARRSSWDASEMQPTGN